MRQKYYKTLNLSILSLNQDISKKQASTNTSGRTIIKRKYNNLDGHEQNADLG